MNGGMYVDEWMDGKVNEGGGGRMNEAMNELMNKGRYVREYFVNI